jgi:hypothetical protein
MYLPQRLSKHHAVKTYSSTHSNVEIMKDSVQLHVLDALSSGEGTPGWVSLRADVGAVEERIIFAPAGNRTRFLDCPTRSLITDSLI